MQARTLSERDIPVLAQLIAETMNEDEGAWAEKALNGHWQAKLAGIDDGRTYFIFTQSAENAQSNNQKDIIGISGIHFMDWGPEENIWLGWFALKKQLWGQEYGRKMMDLTLKEAKKLGYKKFLVETYTQPEFARAVAFYKKAGFQDAGGIKNYLPDQSDMIVLMKYL